MRTEAAILKNLIQNEEYTRKVLPFLKQDYFTENADKNLFSTVHEFVNKYNSLPSEEALQIEMSEVRMNEEEYNESNQLLKDIQTDAEDYTDLNWLLDKTEKFCQDKAIYNAVVESIGILDNPKSDQESALNNSVKSLRSNRNPGALPKLPLRYDLNNRACNANKRLSHTHASQ